MIKYLSKNVCLFKNKTDIYICIKKTWYKSIPLNEVKAKRNKIDGYYRVIYIQINNCTGEYYIGKANRKSWRELEKYQGSGLRFINAYKKYQKDFTRYFISMCNTAEETERLESNIVDKELIQDSKCLNLTTGGGGTNKHPTKEETKQKLRDYIKKHPERIIQLKEGTKKFLSDKNRLLARNNRTKEVMSTAKYKEMTRERIKKWREKFPEEYVLARLKNIESIRSTECNKKRLLGMKKWKESHPFEYKAWQEKLLKSHNSVEAKEKRRQSLIDFNKNNPYQAKLNAKKRADAAKKKNSKAIYMLDLETNQILKRFDSQHDAARWLVENGKAKNTNCVSSISAVCLNKPCSTGYGYHKKSHGYKWCFVENISRLYTENPRSNNA